MRPSTARLLRLATQAAIDEARAGNARRANAGRWAHRQIGQLQRLCAMEPAAAAALATAFRVARVLQRSQARLATVPTDAEIVATVARFKTKKRAAAELGMAPGSLSRRLRKIS